MNHHIQTLTPPMSMSPTLRLLVVLLLFTSCAAIQDEKEARRLNEEGLALFHAGQFEQALVLMRQAASKRAIQPVTRGYIYRNISIVYNNWEQPDSAKHYAGVAAGYFPEESYEYLINTADVYLYDNDTPQALELLKRALALRTDDMSVYNSLGLIYLGEHGDEYQDLDQALEFNSKAYELSKDPNSTFILALTHFEREEFEQAEQYLRAVVEQYGGNADQYCMLGMAQYRLDKKAHAEITWARTLAIDTSYTESIETYKIMYGE